ncbi:sphingomyelin phosphodiesterase [Enterococcus mundtii]|uniref:sphingomyelin phosphodiesterase n=1 Tax=Enterococcus mundtii TaxID=53346 RepID=UPI0011596D6A|nr:sphingomyelin phosphodiesterase [Enterococcus mundtii]
MKKAFWISLLSILIILGVSNDRVNADVYSSNSYTLNIQKISFRNEESDAPEPYGNINFVYYYQNKELQKTIWEEKNSSNPPSISDVKNISINFSSDDLSNLKIIGDVKESDFGNADDILAFPSLPQKLENSGTIRLEGESSGSYVDITYEIQQNTIFQLDKVEVKGLSNTLSWTKLPLDSGVNSYQIYKNNSLLSTLDSNINWYVDKQNQPGNANTYKIVANYSDGTFEKSNEVNSVTATDAQPTISVMSQNMYFLATPTDVNQQLRAKNTISPASYYKDQDIIIYEEVFEDGAFSDLMDGISKNWGFNYHTKVLGNNDANTVPDMNTGGVAIASKWPILKTDEYYFSNKGCGMENLQSKGVMYTQIDVNGQIVNVFGTHTQSDISFLACDGSSVRKAQIKEINDFINSKNIPSNEPIILGGDFNINRYDSDAYNYLLNTLDFSEPQYVGAPYTWDITNNLYAQSSASSGESSAYFDYLFVKNDYSNNTVNIAKPVKVKPEECNSSCKVMISDDPKNVDFTDHYPVTAEVGRN